MKTTKNHSLAATKKLYQQAIELNIKAEILNKSKPETRRYNSLGSTHVPQKIIILNDIRMSLGQAKQYIKART